MSCSIVCLVRGAEEQLATNWKPATGNLQLVEQVYFYCIVVRLPVAESMLLILPVACFSEIFKGFSGVSLGSGGFPAKT